jgi:lipoyl(octanoyl) transferase
VPFAATAALQEDLRARVADGTGPETLLLCEHDPVITLGRGARPHNVLCSRDVLAARGIEVVSATRGGDVTYHGPGQLVGYPIFKLRRGLVAHMELMARALVSVLAGLGVRAHWRRDRPGLWVAEPQSHAKICAFGVHVGRRVAIHGFALNLAVDLSAFATIVPCGLGDARVTSVAALTGATVSPGDLVAATVTAFEQELRRNFQVSFANCGSGPLESISAS